MKLAKSKVHFIGIGGIECAVWPSFYIIYNVTGSDLRNNQQVEHLKHWVLMLPLDMRRRMLQQIWMWSCTLVQFGLTMKNFNKAKSWYPIDSTGRGFSRDHANEKRYSCRWGTMERRQPQV